MYISVTPDRIQPAFWGSVNYVVAPDFRKLTASIEKFGILQPIVCQKSTACLIDGLHRWKAAKLLDGAKTAKEMWDICVEAHGSVERAIEDGQLLHMRRYKDELWQPPK